jgi:putative transposase
MAKPYSQDLRERVVRAVAAGRSRHAVAKLFHLSASAVIKWTKRLDSEGSVAAKPMGGVRRDVLGDQRAWLRARLTEKPDLTLEALRAELAERGSKVSLWTVWSFCRSEKLTFKKKACCQASNCGPVSPAGVSGGSGCSHGLIRPGWCSSTKPGPRPT